jgi:hypothetical protein
MKYLILLYLFSASLCSAQIHLGPNQSYPNIQSAAAANAIQPGDTVYLHAGSYAGYQAVTNLKGTATSWITITRYQNDPIDISGGWQFIQCEYLRFVNLNFKGTAAHPGRLFSIDNGGSCSTQSKYMLVNGCSFSNTTDPAASVAFKFAGVDHFEVSDNVFKDFPVCEAMSYNTCHEGLVRGNRFENCLSGGHIKGGASNITLEGNLFINASKSPWVAYELGGDTGAPFYCPGDSFEVKNLNFYSNLVIGGYRGLALSSAQDCRVVNNTFYNCGQATLRFLKTSNFYPTLSGNQVENNLFAFGASAYFNGGSQEAGAATFSHNIYYSIQNDPFNGPYWDSPQLDAIKDPNPMNFGSGTGMFKDGPGLDFHLSPGCPAVASGINQTAPLSDFYGDPFSLTARSIGAIEVPLISPTKEIAGNPNRVLVFPNPTSEYLNIDAGAYLGPLEIWDLWGHKVVESEMVPGISVAHLPSGVYFLKAGVEKVVFLKW